MQYEDDWYIIGSKPDTYVFIYYRGQNDAWKGYGGATVYTRANSLPPELIPELRQQAEAAGIKWDDMILTDNTCPAHPPKKDVVTVIEEDIEAVEKGVENAIEPSLQSFGKGFTILEQRAEKAAEGLLTEIEKDEVTFVEEIKKEEEAAAKLLKRFEMEAEMGVFGKFVQALPLSIREIIMPIS